MTEFRKSEYSNPAFKKMTMDGPFEFSILKSCTRIRTWRKTASHLHNKTLKCHIMYSCPKKLIKSSLSFRQCRNVLQLISRTDNVLILCCTLNFFGERFRDFGVALVEELSF